MRTLDEIIAELDGLHEGLDVHSDATWHVGGQAMALGDELRGLETASDRESRDRMRAALAEFDGAAARTITAAERDKRRAGAVLERLRHVNVGDHLPAEFCRETLIQEAEYLRRLLEHGIDVLIASRAAADQAAAEVADESRA